MQKDQVEAFAAAARKAYLDQDWTTMSTMIHYPITILETPLNDAESFLTFMSNKTVAPEDAKNIEEETCKNMFNNGQGICMGGGEIWLRDPGYMTDAEPKLEVIALSGIMPA